MVRAHLGPRLKNPITKQFEGGFFVILPSERTEGSCPFWQALHNFC